MAFDAPVGPLDLPLEAVGATLADPVVTALLPYLSHCLNADLNPRLALMTGTSAEAAPATNLFAWDPTEPRAHNVRLPVPSLFVWWGGESQLQQLGPLLWVRERTLRAIYVFDELPGLDQFAARTGLLNAVDASLAKAAQRDRHPTYAPPGLPAGTEVSRSIGEPHAWAWQYLGCAALQRFGIDDASYTTGGTKKKASGRDYPALAASFRVQERVAPEQAERLEDGPATITTFGVDIFERELQGADGSELDEVDHP